MPKKVEMSSMMQSIYVLLAYLYMFTCLVQGQEVDHSSNDTSVSYRKSEVLSRRKRFLIFPEGSSFQLVFCNTYPTVFEIGDIFLWGVTAALAWELPQDPYSPFDHKADPLHRRHDTKMIYYTSEEGKILYKRPYTSKLIVNPAFVKRSVDAPMDTEGIKKGVEKIQIDRKHMHASKNNREFLDGNRERRSVEFHRSSRASLYQKIEPLLQGLGTNGKQCMLKTLCTVGKTQRDPQGTFLQEILRATFTLPKGFSQDDLDEYDAAFTAEKPCDELYPDCEEPFTEPVIRS